LGNQQKGSWFQSGWLAVGWCAPSLLLIESLNHCGNYFILAM
jgi:hypothetical protein